MNIDTNLPNLGTHDLELLEQFRKRRSFKILFGPIISLLTPIILLFPMVMFFVSSAQSEEDSRTGVLKEQEAIEVISDTKDEMASTAEGVDYTVTEMRVFSDPIILSNLYSYRNHSTKRLVYYKYSGKKYGGKYFKNIHKAVIATLQWMKENQAEDGHWPKEGGHSIAMTGLGLLSFLANGKDGSDEHFGECVTKAANYLKDQVILETGLLKGALSEGNDGQKVYTQAITSYALSEFYGMTNLPLFKPVMDKMISALIKYQKDDGSWSYQYSKNMPSDSSLTGWHAQALRAAYASGCRVAGLKEAIEKVSLMFMGNIVTDPKSKEFGYGYYHCGKKKGSPRFGLGAVAALCLQLYGEGKSSGVNAAVERIVTEFTTTEEFSYLNPKLSSGNGGKCCDFYYQTQVIFQYQDIRLWRSWNKKFLYEQLYKNQIRSKSESTGKIIGYWDLPGDPEKGKKLAPWLRFYCTALNCLTLQVYYRNFPITKKMSFKAEKTPSSKNQIYW